MLPSNQQLRSVNAVADPLGSSCQDRSAVSSLDADDEVFRGLESFDPSGPPESPKGIMFPSETGFRMSSRSQTHIEVLPQDGTWHLVCSN